MNVNQHVETSREDSMHKFVLRMMIVVLMGFVFYACGYNTMQQNEEAVFSAWGDVESTLQRRADLIPNLVEVVKGYAAHERETLEAVINARAKATSVEVSASDLSNPAAMQQLQAAQGALSSALALKTASSLCCMVL